MVFFASILGQLLHFLQAEFVKPRKRFRLRKAGVLDF